MAAWVVINRHVARYLVAFAQRVQMAAASYALFLTTRRLNVYLLNEREIRLFAEHGAHARGVN